MKIRKATPKDTPEIVNYLMLAMEDVVYGFIGEHSKEKATQFLTNLVRKKSNQYSYENCWVAELENEVVGAIVMYDGAKLLELRQPVAEEIKSMFNRDFNPENETEAGEFYLDSGGVSSNLQGKGIGSKLLNFLIDEYVHKRQETLGLLVDKENPNAKKLYLRLGFEVVGEKTLVGKEMDHMQLCTPGRTRTAIARTGI